MAKDKTALEGNNNSASHEPQGGSQGEKCPATTAYDSSENELLDSENELLDSENELLSSENELLSSENESLKSEIEILKSEIEALKSEIELLSSENELLSSENDLLSSENDLLISEDDSAGAPDDSGSPPDDAGCSPDDSGCSPDDSGSPPDDAGCSPDDSGCSPDGAGSSPDDSGCSPDGAGCSPDGAGRSPNGAGRSPDDSGSPPDDAGCSPDDSGCSPDGAGSAPNGAGSAPSDPGCSPDGAGRSPDDPGRAPDGLLGGVNDSAGGKNAGGRMRKGLEGCGRPEGAPADPAFSEPQGSESAGAGARKRGAPESPVSGAKRRKGAQKLNRGGRNQLIILGAGVMQGPAIELAKDMGLETVVVDGDPQALWASRADRFEHIDLKDKEGIETLALSLQEGGRLGGIMTAGTDFSATVAWVAERLDLPGIPYEAALNASDKGRMRRCFRDGGIPTPGFMILKSPPTKHFSLPVSYPLVVKPVDNMGGRGCRRIDSAGDLEAAVSDALRFSRSGRVIVEEYLDGPEFSVDAIVYRGEIIICGLADRHIFFPPFFIEMGHTMPARLDAGASKALLDAFKDGVRALGLAGEESFGAAKGDLKLTSKGPRIGEIAARLSGGYMSGWTFPYASGVEVTRGAILAALGQEPGDILVPSRSWTSAERAFISIPGTVRSLHGLEEVRAMPHVKDLFLRTEAGGRVAFPENNVGKCGNVITAATDRETAVNAAETAVRAVHIRLESPDAETDAFLSPLPGDVPAEGGFPPNAFSLGADLAALLAALPDPGLSPASAGPAGPIGSAGSAGPSLLPFPALVESGLRDYQGRTAAESLEAVRELTGFPLPLDAGGKSPYLGRLFWAALVRGGYQGAAYFVDRHFPARANG